MPKMGELGAPKGPVTGNIRVDHQPNDYVLKIEQKGPRFAWMRAVLCPCAPINDQTDQPAIDCTECKRTGFLWFGPPNAVADDPKVGQLDAVQRLALGEGAVIRGLISSISEREVRDHPWGRWAVGDTVITVRPENRIAHGDRLVCIDSETTYKEVVTITDPKLALATRFPIVRLNLALRLIETAAPDGTLKSTTRKRLDAGDLMVKDGTLVWHPGRAPAKGSRISIHYDCHPSYIVIEHPNVFRFTNVAKKRKKPRTPAGEPTSLPLRAKIALEYAPPK